MRALHLFIAFFSILFGCNNPKEKRTQPQTWNNIDYEDQGLELKDGNNIIKFTIASVHIHGDTININYIDSLQYFDFYVHYLKDTSWCEFVQEVTITDSSYRKPTFTIISKNIYLDLERKKYPTLKLTGSINVEIERHHTWAEDFKDTIRISGILKTTLD